MKNSQLSDGCRRIGRELSGRNTQGVAALVEEAERALADLLHHSVGGDELSDLLRQNGLPCRQLLVELRKAHVSLYSAVTHLEESGLLLQRVRRSL